MLYVQIWIITMGCCCIEEEKKKKISVDLDIFDLGMKIFSDIFVTALKYLV